MRKFIGIVIGVTVIASYFIYTKNLPTTNNLTNIAQKNFDQNLVDFTTQMEAGYPSTPEDVVTSYSDLLQLAYSEHADTEDIVALVEMMRTLYSSELLLLNDANKQVINLVADVENQREQANFLLQSSIARVEYLENTDEMTIIMTHTMTNFKITREYYVVKENDQWKIFSFKDVGVEQFSASDALENQADALEFDTLENQA
ncbi:DUF6715 family protein [Candidatus Epulonipiscium viviparus]|uniref:DUF6715 family protein n=1 Tax=Candidatus Epulonipiscium viviparus TaxID=420336 RepID=UPI00016BFF4D|nr:DUF6715 family protein [Candidatus Epulopiscium viviparus]